MKNLIGSLIRVAEDDYTEAFHLIEVLAKEMTKEDGDQLLYEWRQKLLSENLCPTCGSYELEVYYKQGEQIEHHGTPMITQEAYKKCQDCGWSELND